MTELKDNNPGSNNLGSNNPGGNNSQDTNPDSSRQGEFNPHGADFFSERDPEDVLTISHLLRAVFVLTALLFLSGGMSFYLAIRKPDLVVVDKTSGRTLAINNRDYGQTEAVTLTPDKLTDRDKKALVTEFLRCLYEVNGATRPGQVNRLLKMMEPNLSLSQAQFFNNEKLLAEEKADGVNSSWELQDIAFDERDPYIVRALGRRIVRRVPKEGGAGTQEETQIKVKFLLMDSPTAPVRNENNYRTGFYVLKYRAESVDGTRKSPLMLLSDESTASRDVPGATGQNPAGVSAVSAAESGIAKTKAAEPKAAETKDVASDAINSDTIISDKQ